MNTAAKLGAVVALAPLIALCGLGLLLVAPLGQAQAGCFSPLTSPPTGSNRYATSPAGVVSSATRARDPAATCATTAGWRLPLQPDTYRLSSGYGPRWGTVHYGLDFAAPAGTPILAAAAGTVLSATCTSPYCDRPGSVTADGTPITPGCGWRVQIQHAGDVVTTYCHARALAVHEGQIVAAGAVIAWVGSTGNSTGNHLHFQIHLHSPPATNATTVDPAAYLRGVGVDL